MIVDAAARVMSALPLIFKVVASLSSRMEFAEVLDARFTVSIAPVNVVVAPAVAFDKARLTMSLLPVRALAL
jgi:hypothetical protein